MAVLQFFIAATMLPASVLGAVEFAASFTGRPGVPNSVSRTWLPGTYRQPLLVDHRLNNPVDGTECAWLAVLATGPYTIGPTSPTYQSKNIFAFLK